MLDQSSGSTGKPRMRIWVPLACYVLGLLYDNGYGRSVLLRNVGVHPQITWSGFQIIALFIFSAENLDPKVHYCVSVCECVSERETRTSIILGVATESSGVLISTSSAGRPYQRCQNSNPPSSATNIQISIWDSVQNSCLRLPSREETRPEAISIATSANTSKASSVSCPVEGILMENLLHNVTVQGLKLW
jgi:hypothetical protein